MALETKFYEMKINVMKNIIVVEIVVRIEYVVRSCKYI